MPLDRLPATAAGDERRALSQLGDESAHSIPAHVEYLVANDLRREHPHRRLSLSLAPLPSVGQTAGIAVRREGRAR
jgi:hypothetical protein